MSDLDLFYGEVIFFSPKAGYGFISWEKNGIKQKDMFVHYSDINVNGFKTLFKSQKVSFNVGENKRNQPKAINVTVLNN